MKKYVHSKQKNNRTKEVAKEEKFNSSYTE